MIGVSVIREPAYAEQILRENKVDFIGSARAMFADPDWAVKAKEGRENEIRHCISCLYCMESLMAADQMCIRDSRRPGSTGNAMLTEEQYGQLSEKDKQWYDLVQKQFTGDAETTAQMIRENGGEASACFADISDFQEAELDVYKRQM